MCFRPTSANKPIECPNCKKKLAVVAGIKQKKCPMCGTDLEAAAAEKAAEAAEKTEEPKE